MLLDIAYRIIFSLLCQRGAGAPRGNASCMDLLRQCVNTLFQPVDLPLNSFEPFALVDFPPVFEDADGMGLNAGDMLVAPTQWVEKEKPDYRSGL